MMSTRSRRCSPTTLCIPTTPLRERLPGATSNTATSTTERRSTRAISASQEAAQSPYAAQQRRPDLGDQPIGLVQVSARSGVNHVPRKCGVVLITMRSDGGHDPVARGGPTLSSSSRFETSALRRPPACRAAPRSGSQTSSAARQRARTGANRSTAGYRRRRRRPSPTVPQGEGIHQAQGDRDSTMSGSVEATAAIALMRMSSGTPASRMAATRWLATAARSSWLIPRPAWAWSSRRPS
jgi:hypothetical protein